MKKGTGIPLVFMIVLLLSGCTFPKKPPPMGDVFDISGSPNPLYYGGCGPATLKFTVAGPGDNLRINSIIVGYNLISGSGVKIKTGTVNLAASPSDPPVTYTGSVTFSIAGGSGAAAPDVAIMDFGEGRVDFAATVYATYLTPPSPPTGSSETYYFTSTKSVAVVPCLPTPTVPPRIGVPGLTVMPPILPPMEVVTPTPFPIAIPPKPTKEDKGGGPPACIPDPNNPNNPCP